MVSVRAFGRVGACVVGWWPRVVRRAAPVVAVSSVVLMAPSAPPAPVAPHVAPAVKVSDPYASRARGFDLSFPNCRARPRHGRRFAVVGVDNGRPFTVNPCAGREWRRSTRATRTRPSLYFNTAYDATYERWISPGCAIAVDGAHVFGRRRGRTLDIARSAWEIGCSEVAYAASVGLGVPRMWWADVETGNSWSPHPGTNRMTLDGIAYGMRVASGRRPAGIYSAPFMWAALTGSQRWRPTPAVSAMWVAGGSCRTRIARTPAWLSQGGLVFGIDADVAC